VSDIGSGNQVTLILRPRSLLAGIAVALLGLVVFGFMSGRLTVEMLKDRGYYRWAHGKGHYDSKYLSAFARDSRLQQRFVGEPVDSLHALFPRLWGGPGCSIRPLKQLNAGHRFRSSREWYGSYWLDQTQHGLVYVALLVDGKVVDFCWVRRD
jgi:hypothetical protein